jgi:hypothetical protein
MHLRPTDIDAVVTVRSMGLPQTTSPSSQAKLRPSQLQNPILVASPLCPTHPLLPQSPPAGFASDQVVVVVVHLLKMPTVIIKSAFPVL